MKPVRLLMFAGFLLFPPGIALADEPDDEELEMELFFAPAETVESAARHVQPLEQSPSAVTVLTREDIEASGARTLPEVLRLVPGIDIHAVKPLWSMVGMRGKTTITSDTLLLLVDGRDATWEFFGFPPWNLQHFSMDDVERIEVIRGPGSALYGANAYSGVVHVITRSPGDDNGALLSLRGGEHGRSELACRGSQRLGPVSLSVSAGSTREDFWTGRDETGLDLLRGRINGKINLGADTRLLFDSGVFQTSGSIYATSGILYMEDLIHFYGRSRFDYQDLSVQATYERMVFDAFLDMALVYNGIELATLDPFDGFTDKVSVLAQHTLEFYYNRLTYGAEYIYNHYYAPISVKPHLYEHRAGFFVQDEVDLGSILENLAGAGAPLFLTAGLRVDLNSVTRHEVSPRASLVYMPGERHSFRFGYAHAFLKPTFFESSMHIHMESKFGFEELDLSRTNLANQRIDSLELGYSGSFLDERLVVRIDLAYNWYKNDISFELDPDEMGYIERAGIRIPDIGGGGFGFINEPEGKNGHNVELQLIARPTERSRVFFQASYRQVFMAGSGAFLKNEPVWGLVAGLDLSPASGWTASLRAFYTASHRESLGSPDSALEPSTDIEVPAAWFLNARVARKVVESPFGLSVGLEGFNLLGHGFREFPGISYPNVRDYGGETLGRRIVLFLQGEI